MISCNKTLILFLLLLIPELLSAQDIVSRTNHSLDYRIPYRYAGGSLYDHGNAILREMAKEVLREPWLVNVHIFCDLELSIERENDRNQLYISIRHLILKGDTVFRHFPVTDVLLPPRISLKLRWANRADTSGYAEETIAGKPFARGDSLVCVVPAPSFDPKVDTLLARDIELFYDSIASNSFFARIEHIHDYYASVSLLDSLQRFTENLALEDASLLPLNYLKVQELCGVLARIDSLDFPRGLLQHGHDPSALMRKFNQVYKHSRSCIYNFIDEMHRIGAIPWDGNGDRLAAYFTSRVFSYVRRSYLMDYQQGHIYGDCLAHFYDRSAFPAEDQVETKMLAKMFPAAMQDTLARYISGRIYASYLNTARKLMDQNQFAEVFSMLENSRRFVAENRSLQGITPDSLLQSLAAEGIFNSFIGIASSCISGRNFNMAGIYLEKAGQYAARHSGYIRSDSNYRAVFSELFFLRNTECDQLLLQKKYQEALDCYKQFETSYSARDLTWVSRQLEEKKSLARLGLSKLSVALTTDALKSKSADTALFYYEQAAALRHESKSHRPVANGFDSLAPVMAGFKYNQMVKEGTLALEKRQFTLAVHRLKDAKSLADSCRINHNPEFDSIYRQAMKNLLIVQLSVSQKKIWANQFDSAQVAIQRTEATGIDFGLSDDPDLTTAIDNYKLKIREQHCRNLQDSVDLRMIRTDLSIALRNYINARAYLQQALDFARSATVCNIAEQPIVDTLARYAKAASYQQKLAETSSLVASGNYDEAMLELDANQKTFQADQLSQYGLRMEDAYDFIRERDNPYFTEKAVLFYAGRENSLETLKVLLLAHEQGAQEGTLTDIQNQLGQKIAREDYSKGSLDDPLKNVIKYVPSDGWFDSFRKGYKAEWNRLVKTTVSGSR